VITLPITFDRPLTDDDLDGLAEAEVRFELDQGRLILSAWNTWWHHEVLRRLSNQLVLRGHLAYRGQGIRLSSSTVRYPDITVIQHRPGLPIHGRHDPADISLLAEVISAESANEDRVVKAQLYARAGVAEYWLADRHPIDPDDAIVEIFKLGRRDRYTRVSITTLTELEG